MTAVPTGLASRVRSLARSALARTGARGRNAHEASSVDLHQRLRQLELEKNHIQTVFQAWVPPGHFYSPFPDLADYERRADGLLDPNKELFGLELHEAEQVELVGVIADLVADLPFPESDDGTTRYWFDNPAYAWSDGTVLHGVLRHLRPRRVVEVGSGYSSAMILDTVDGWLGGTTEMDFVEPFADLLHSLLRPGDESRATIHETGVQDVELGVFTRLEAGDVLFIDSTHVVRPGSDVNHLVFEVLPRLRPGVWVHLHDVFFPFEYPKAWVQEGRAWQETYLLRAFLTFNDVFEIRWFQHYLWTHHRELLEARMPWMAKNAGGNLWLEKAC